MQRNPDFRHPIKLAHDNFTKLSRTPWAGEVIGRDFKGHLDPKLKGLRIGEAWEFSSAPGFISLLADDPAMNLRRLADQYPEEVFSRKLAASGYRDFSVLVKLINAAEPLSFQVHPDDQDPDLSDDECGKPESWYILDVNPGPHNGIYLGFNQQLEEPQLRQLLESGADIKDLMQFVPVSAGDYFEIAPGVVHAIGAGVTLLEPQRLVPGKNGKTYRLWDWNRRYAPSGKKDPKGEPRALHIQEGLKLIDLSQQVGEGFVHSLRRIPQVKELMRSEETNIVWRAFPSNSYYQLHILEVQSQCQTSVELEQQDGYCALLTLDGQFQCGGHSYTKGVPALLAGGTSNFSLTTDSCQLAAIAPSSATIKFSA